MNAQRRLSNSNKASGESMEKLASGFRINKAADDAAGLAISEKMKAGIRSEKQAKRNASDGVSMLQVAEGAMNEVSNILIRMRELATQSASDTVSDVESSLIEYSQLINEIDRISNVTEFSGVQLLKSSDEIQIHVGKGDGTAENSDRIQINAEEMATSAEALNVSGTEIGSRRRCS